jgi:hypothetical protein
MNERLNLRRRAKETLTDVSDASKTVIETTQWATIALIAVTAVSVLALGISLYTLSKVSNES